MQMQKHSIALLDHARHAGTVSAGAVIDNDTLESWPTRRRISDAERASHVDMVRALRSPGSTLKPFCMRSRSPSNSSESLLADVPQSFAGYQPSNFNVLHGRSAYRKRSPFSECSRG
jgi:membrane carboxypeptidase/penicillin-binding protein PbpC